MELEGNLNELERWLHDARTPLTTAKLKAQYLQRSLASATASPERIQSILSELIAALNQIGDALEKPPGTPPLKI